MKKMEEDPSYADNMLEDHSNIEFLLNMSYLFKTLRLVIMILSVSFFIGMFFFIYIDIIDRIFYSA